MSFEDSLNRLNENFFFKEFTYSNNKFKKPSGEEVEIADSIFYLDDIAFVFQLKERDTNLATTPEKEKKWFNKKVCTDATRQIRDTLSYLREYDEVNLSNNRGRSIDVSTLDISTVHKIVIHKSSDILPEDKRSKKFHESETAGIIHIFQAHDYLGVLQYLVTPAEVSEYLKFRESLAGKWKEELNAISEPAILGHYLSGDEESAPSEKFKEYLAALEKDQEKWDVRKIIHLFPERVLEGEDSSQYYLIIRELARLMRNELAIFKERFFLSWEAVKNSETEMPYRFYSPRTGCSFLFIPLLECEKEGKLEFLENLTVVNKYDLKSEKAIGIAFSKAENESQNVDWCFTEFPWEDNPEIDALLEKHYPFRKAKEAKIDRYSFR